MTGVGQWSVSFSGTPIMLHAALWVRQAARVLPNDPCLPKRLLDPVPRADVKIDPKLWREWWQALQHGPDSRGTAFDRWPAAPTALRPVLDEFGDAPLVWAQTLAEHRNPYRPPRYQLPVDAALAKLRRESTGRASLEARVYGLAVEGNWVHVVPESSVVLASWAALARPQEWLTEALRDTVRPLAS
ncbi:hypothetical protein ATK74_2440 [Propionicimonas paludicola]|uniref:Uncharacterized protein n=1 Tax=Propionicimonas paludicola TaxID=185243 RepID=A0A2A9CTT8_9ACTN|nr:hypothetical protein [Propionicimonas paludicola]PFG17863.1 hypothetical protein ATK74_2440 [Propionicimonas paludicola]